MGGNSISEIASSFLTNLETEGRSCGGPSELMRIMKGWDAGSSGCGGGGDRPPASKQLP